MAKKFKELSPKKSIEVPCNYVPRWYQLPFWYAMNYYGKKRACLVWHRRSGKTKSLLNFAIQSAFDKVGVYYHCFPEYAQGRKVVWDAIDDEQQRVLDRHAPKVIVKSMNKQEMKVEFVNGSIYQIIGADNYDSVVGANPMGLILDEFAISDRYPQAWDYFRPILTQNGGWAVFGFTPRGRNHGFNLYQMALANDDWFCEILGVDRTKAIGLEAIEADRKSGMPESMIQQEYYCDFVSSVEDIVIPFGLIRDALDRDLRFDLSPRIAGLDVARFGDDRTALVVRQGGAITYIEKWGMADVVETAGRVKDRWHSKLFDIVAVDSIGVGAGVADLLRANGVPTVMVQVNETARNEERFYMLRDELWWGLRDWFEEGACCIAKTIENGLRMELVKDIQDIHYRYTPSGKIRVEGKDELKKADRLGRSPDLGDALCLTFSSTAKMMVGDGYSRRVGGSSGASNWDRKGRKKDYGSYQEFYVG